MPLIPTDVGLRLRLDNELLPQQIAPVQEVEADLPRLQAGQLFTARIRDVLPENTYVALVAGKAVTLSLPQSVKSGDVLELVVIDQTPKTIIAELANQPAATTTAADEGPQLTRLSQAAQMLRSLLINEGETTESAPLNRGQPLLAQPPRSGAELAPVLSKAVAESGLFYEAHQAQWVAGKLPLTRLLQEPQGQHPPFSPPQPPQQSLTQAATPAAPAMAPTPTLPEMLATVQPQTAAQPTATVPVMPAAGLAAPLATEAEPAAATAPLAQPIPQAAANGQTAPPGLNKIVAQSILLYQANQAQSPLDTAQAPPAQATAETAPAPTPTQTQTQEAAKAMAPTPTATAPVAGPDENPEAARLQSGVTTPQPQTAQTIPDDLRALVQQQLDAAGTQRLLWHGEVWPGQTMQWQLEWQEHGGSGSDENAEPWQTTLRLTTPRLGELEASLQLGAAGVRISLSTAEASVAAEMKAGVADLENALTAAGVPLLGFAVKQIQESEE